MKIRDWAGLAVLAATLCGCASMNKVGSQDIQLDITPMMAICEAYQSGEVVGRYDPSRQSITVPERSGSTDIVCLAPGYKDKRITVVPDSPAVFGALLIDFGPVDRTTYPGRLQIVMEPADRQGQPR